ncbi:hypothetical protein J3459_022553 [Metarhizium acridum]|uniref:uncharacterized protein n=1 Tax=Metarhizium acridum TaxID=92637 RepID=UPI001C6C5AEA|nr:hypothetical protein J3458_022431 [Metarhizium acridum]KAG8428765.1 hypothetical protein J3459_022553 [Metarhizium acridum]
MLLRNLKAPIGLAVLSSAIRCTPTSRQTPHPSRLASSLKVEESTNTSNYTLAPVLALSRIVYQSKTLKGSLVPEISIYPVAIYASRRWFGGTSGIYAECAPSHVRSLSFHFSGPYSLALAGYAVVGTDYAGLGVSWVAPLRLQ